MVTSVDPRPPWQEGHFIGGHPALDLTNTVFSRSDPVDENELLNSPTDVLTWCVSAGLFKRAPRFPDAAARKLVTAVREVREHAWAVFAAISRDEALPTEHLGRLLELAGAGVRAGHIAHMDIDLDDIAVNCKAPEAIPAALSMLAVHAVFTLPPDRIRACNRCGWLFLDSSRGGRRRWCSMSTCGNREKATRHRRVVS